MNYVGVDLHKQIIVLCVVVVESGRRRVLLRRKMSCRDTEAVGRFFQELGPFSLAVEATAAYEWLVERVERIAERIVLVHPRKMRIIAESRRKTDKLDAFIPADFLAADELPEAWRPTPRVREHRGLARQLDYLRRKTSGVKCRLRSILARYNADVPNLFTAEGREHLRRTALNAADRFVCDQLTAMLDFQRRQRLAMLRRLRKFAARAGTAEREARDVLATFPCVGPLTIETLLSELGDVRRFRSQDDAAQYAGLAPGVRESAGHRKDQGITKEGSPALRWSMIQLAWRLVGKTRRWSFLFEKLRVRCGKKKAIVAVARRALCVLMSLLRSGQRYNAATEMLTKG